jgi:hypothetical protein
MTESKKKKCLVISQPMYFPWPGLLEQYRLADQFIYYDDVQFTKGFFNRVQIKSAKSQQWLTVPLLARKRGQLINEVRIDNREEWKSAHRNKLWQAYKNSPFVKDMLDLVDEVFMSDHKFLGELALASTEALVTYYPSLKGNIKPIKSSETNILGSGTQRLIDICKAMDASAYLTGHGARHYLKHDNFAERDIDIYYIDYSLSPYPQAHGDFTPYVSTLDLIANCGPKGIEQIRGQMLPWRTFLTQMFKMDKQS